MREKAIELRLKSSTEKLGGMCLKLVSVSIAGVPDRLVLLPGGRVAFVELKAPGKKPSKQQLAVHQQLRELGFKVEVLDNVNSIEKFTNAI
ncbi:MAG: VRR-NUC domain-containing protein [Gammaproteobacteria bacterium]|nr:VRR-NUC domain-containing protein [Gammaproteobacteria bacterium]